MRHHRDQHARREHAVVDRRGHGLLPSQADELEPRWQQDVAEVFAQATLAVPTDPWAQRGGRNGRHTEHLGFLLAEMQFLQRAYPGAQW